MKKFLEKFDKAMNWIANRMVVIIIIAVVIWLFVEYVFPYEAGMYEFFTDYHNKRK